MFEIVSGLSDLYIKLPFQRLLRPAPKERWCGRYFAEVVDGVSCICGSNVRNIERMWSHVVLGSVSW